MKRKIKDFVGKILYSIYPQLQITVLERSKQNSYSQAGEDAVVSFLFSDYGIRNIKYLDLGTNIPNFGNNTYAFYKRGSTGVCVEADASLIENIKKIRSRDKVINAGVAPQNGEADFYVFNEPAISTFDKEEAQFREGQGNYQIERVVKVPLITINKIIEDNFETYPHFLSVDIEGLDLMVLKTLDFEKYPIPAICVETCTYSENHIRPKDSSIKDYMETRGYEVYADTYINTIFVNKNWFYNK